MKIESLDAYTQALRACRAFRVSNNVLMPGMVSAYIEAGDMQCEQGEGWTAFRVENGDHHMLYVSAAEETTVLPAQIVREKPVIVPIVCNPRSDGAAFERMIRRSGFEAYRTFLHMQVTGAQFRAQEKSGVSPERLTDADACARARDHMAACMDAYTEPVPPLSQLGCYQMYGYLADGEPVSAVLMRRMGRLCRAEHLYTLESARGKGIGMAVLSYALQNRFEQDERSVAELWVDADKVRLGEAYRALGFEYTGKKTRQFIRFALREEKNRL